MGLNPREGYNTNCPQRKTLGVNDKGGCVGGWEGFGDLDLGHGLFLLGVVFLFCFVRCFGDDRYGGCFFVLGGGGAVVNKAPQRGIGIIIIRLDL